MQNLQHIKRLIDLFLEGESTLEQEQELAQFFSTHEVKDEWKPVQRMFAYFDNGMVSPPTSTSNANHTRSRWGYWAAALTAAAVAAVAFIVLRPAPQTAPASMATQPIAESKTQAKEPVDTLPIEVSEPKTALTASSSKPRQRHHREQRQRVEQVPSSRKSDSIEFVRTQAELEIAEQELVADRIILQQELQQVQRQQRPASPNSGWVTTSLNIQ